MVMNNNKKTKDQSAFEKLSAKVSKASGSTGAFIAALSVIVIWLVSGPVFGFSDTWHHNWY
jgi:low affinity Fe/Cu permease